MFGPTLYLLDDIPVAQLARAMNERLTEEIATANMDLVLAGSERIIVSLSFDCADPYQLKMHYKPLASGNSGDDFPTRSYESVCG